GHGTAGLEAARGRVPQEAAVLRELIVRLDAPEDLRARAALPRPRISSREIRLGPDGPGGENRRRSGAPGPPWSRRRRGPADRRRAGVGLEDRAPARPRVRGVQYLLARRAAAPGRLRRVSQAF